MVLVYFCKTATMWLKIFLSTKLLSSFLRAMGPTIYKMHLILYIQWHCIKCSTEKFQHKSLLKWPFMGCFNVKLTTSSCRKCSKSHGGQSVKGQSRKVTLCGSKLKRLPKTNQMHQILKSYPVLQKNGI